MTQRRQRRSGVAAVARKLMAQRLPSISLRAQIVGAMLGLVLVIFALAWPGIKAHLQAIAVLDLVANKPVPWPLHFVSNEQVVIRNVSIDTANGPVQGKLYTPAEDAGAPAIVILHGVHHMGMNEPRLMSFASAMAACGVRVLTPELPSIADYHVGSNSIATIGDAATWMAQRNGGKVGIMGLSFSGGLALMAASDPRWSPSIAFVTAIGSQDSMLRVAQYYRMGTVPRPDGTLEVLKPHEYGALVLEYEHLEDFIPAADIPALRAVLRAHLYEDGPAEQAAVKQLTDAQLAEMKIMLDASAPATKTALEKSEQLRAAEMATVSPHGHLQDVHVPVFLLHGEGDNIIPSAETLWMEQELPKGELKAGLVSPVLSHINLDGANPTAGDQWRLVDFFAQIFRAVRTR